MKTSPVRRASEGAPSRERPIMANLCLPMEPSAAKARGRALWADAASFRRGPIVEFPMPERPRPSSEPTVSCEVCLKEIPRSEAKSSEGREYTHYFCGLECYGKWLSQSDLPEEPEEPEKE